MGIAEKENQIFKKKIFFKVFSLADENTENTHGEEKKVPFHVFTLISFC